VTGSLSHQADESPEGTSDSERQHLNISPINATYHVPGPFWTHVEVNSTNCVSQEF